ncbi:MAG: hypothetical protein AB1489_39705 [Acidobacteriota bacterium]
MNESKQPGINSEVDNNENREQKSSVSQSSSDEEIIAFWDTHDPADFWSEEGDGEEVHFEISPTIRKSGRLTEAEKEAIRAGGRIPADLLTPDEEGNQEIASRDESGREKKRKIG